MSHTDSSQRDLRRRNISSRWVRFRWDSFGRSRLEVWTTSSLGLGLGFIAMFTSAILELFWRGVVPETQRVSPDFVFTPGGRFLLIATLLFGAWAADRHFEAVTAVDAKLPSWLRALRFLVLTVPLLGILVSLALYRLAQENPRLRRTPPSRPPLALEETPSRSRAADLLRKTDLLLLASFQHLWVFFVWIAFFQVLPFFAVLELLGRDARSDSTSRMIVATLCILLRIGAVGAFFIFVKGRLRELQLKKSVAVAVYCALTATLLPLPISLVAMLVVLFLSSSRVFVPDEATALATIYKRRNLGRALRDTGPAPRVAKVHGEAERRRSRFYTLKTALLAFEVTALAWLLAPQNGVASISPASWQRIVVLSSCAVIPGVFVWLMRVVARTSDRWPRLAGLASLPHVTFLVLLPLIVVLAFIAGSFAGLGYREALASFTFILHLESLCIVLLIGSIHAITTLLARVPVPSFNGIAFGMTVSISFVVASGALGAPGLGSRILLAGRDLCPMVFLGSPLFGLLFGHWLLRPFGFRHLFDRRIPGRIRRVLASFAVSAVLPLGGLAIPFWIWARYRLGEAWERGLDSDVE